MLSILKSERRELFAVFLIVLLGVLLGAALSPGTASAHLTTTNAHDAAAAAAYDKSECGVGSTWFCNTAQWYYPQCWRPDGWVHTRTCHGVTQEFNVVAQFRYCEIVTHWTHGALSYHWNYCRHPGTVPL